MPKTMTLISKVTTILLMFLSSHANSYVTVGTDVDCDLPPTSLQNAISSNASVRVTNQVSYPAIQVINRNAELLGGFNNCNDANNLIAGANYTQISGENTQTAIKLQTTSAGGHSAQTVNLSGLDIHSGSNSSGTIGGGVNIVGNMTVSISNSIIRNNTAGNSGGGVYINGFNGAELILNNVNVNNNHANRGGGIMANSLAKLTITDSELSFNTANYGGAINVESDSQVHIENSQLLNNTVQTGGGGISCLSGGQIETDENTLIAYNHSVLSGGGIYAQSDCHILLSSGDNLAVGQSTAGLNFNTAEVLGGGAYVLNATLQLIGNDTHFANLLNNSTLTEHTGSGGGIYARGQTAKVRIINGRLNHNHSTSGSAIYLTEGANLNMKRSSGQCFGNQLCSEVADNQADFSGAIRTSECATADIYQTTFRDNSGGLASVLHSSGNGTDECLSTFEGNQVFDNHDEGSESDTLFYLDNQVILDFAFNTVTDNLTDRIFSIGSTDSTSQELIINSSLIWNSPADVIVGTINHTFSGQCFNVHSFVDLPAAFGPVITSQDPVFENPLFNNYKMTQQSPTMDFCDTNVYQPKHHDINGVPRGFAWLPAVLGPYDMGAFEYNHIHVNDVIFYDRFD